MPSSTQTSLDEFENPDQCTAIAEHTEERCQHPAVPGFEYCHQHLTVEDLRRAQDSLATQ